MFEIRAPYPLCPCLIGCTLLTRYLKTLSKQPIQQWPPPTAPLHVKIAAEDVLWGELDRGAGQELETVFQAGYETYGVAGTAAALITHGGCEVVATDGAPVPVGG